MIRSVQEIRARCSSILSDEKIVSLVDESSSPSAAFEMIFAVTNNSDKSKAGRWLAVLRRDYLEEYRKLVSFKPSHVSNDTAQTEKETQS